MSTRPILWTPSPERANATTLAGFMRWLKAERGLEFADYPALWDWSVSDLDGFWSAIWEHFDLQSSAPHTAICPDRKMPGATWFPGAMINYVDQILRHAREKPQAVAMITHSETFGRTELTWADFHQQVANTAEALREMGVGQGDRVVAVLPNTEAAMIACCATVSLGAIWSLCAPDMGHVAILDRFTQIEPKVLIAQDGYLYGGKMKDRRALLATICAGLPTVSHRIWIPVAGDIPANGPEGSDHAWASVIQGTATLETTQVPFDHPLWIVYSSGTTGNPKPIVHGHGGALIESAKQSLHQDISSGDRYMWVTSSGWIMWNSQHASLARGATITLFDGAVNHPDMMAVWKVAEQEKLTYLGAGAAFFETCRKAGIHPKELDLSALRSVGSTGSPLSADGYDWVYQSVKEDVWLAPISGGTDLMGAFVGGNPMLPVRAAEMQCRFLGNAVRAYDEAGNEVFDQVGELVCTEPLPSMPLYFWGDEDGSRLHGSYFDTYPGIWRHGDWIEITPDGRSVIWGRSDATINRKGLRLGSAEIYQAVEGLDEVLESLVVDLEFLGRDSFMPLFVVLAEGVALSDALKDRINDAIRASVSARFVPNEINQIASVPRTLSGKKLEVPVKKLLLGGDPARVVNRDSMANPDSFDYFIDYAKSREDSDLND